MRKMVLLVFSLKLRIEILKFAFTQFKIVEGVRRLPPNFNKASIDLRFREKWANVLTVD